MKVKSKLADVEFILGSMERKGDILVISNDPSQLMRSRVYVTPNDVAAFLGKLLTSPSALLFVIGFPVFYFRYRRKRSPGKGSSQ